MNKSSINRKGFIHLYNPREEGLGSYDVHYINAYKKIGKRKYKNEMIKNERYVA